MNDLIGYLERHLDPQGLGLLEAVDHIVDKGYLRDHILSVLEEGRNGHPAGVAAYLHPNGFVKIRIAARSGEWSVRLHYWNQSEMESHAHSHRWDFASRLLLGTLRARIYHLSPGDGHKKYLCRRTDEDGYLLDDIGSCSLSLQAVHTHSQGTSYLQERQLLHTVETATGPPIITVVVQGRDVADHSLVVASAEEEPPKQLPVLGPDPSQTTSLLKRTLELLQ